MGRMKYLPALFITVLFLLVAVNVPVNEYTFPLHIVFFTVYLLTVSILLGWYYIIPRLPILRNWSLGRAKVVKSKYLILRRVGVPQYVGYVFGKLSYTTSIAYASDKERERYLSVASYSLSAFPAEVGVMLIYNKTWLEETPQQILRREIQKQYILASSKQSQSTRDRIDELRSELRSVMSKPVITSGWLVIWIRAYGNTEHEVIQELNNYEQSLKGHLSGSGLVYTELLGEELRSLIDVSLFGFLPTKTWLS